MGKYGLTYGRFSLLPILKGRILYDNQNAMNIVNVTIRPFGIGLFILGFFYFLVLIGLIMAVIKNDTSLLFFLCLFIVVTYTSLIMKYNKEVNTYIEFFESKILLSNFKK